MPAEPNPGRLILRTELRRLEAGALKGRRRTDALAEAGRRIQQTLSPTTVGGWFERGTPAKDFDTLWALVEVLLEWSGHRRPDGLTGPDRAQATARWAGTRELWKARWEQAKDRPSFLASPGPGPRHPLFVPHQVGEIPGRAHSLQDRAEAEQLRQALSGGGTAVLAGMGGVGKTQLVADYARRAQERGTVDILVWITAGDVTAVESGFARAGTEVLGADPADPRTAARTFRAWLEPKATARPYRWLVVLDDVTDPADLTGCWPPSSPYGRTLVTTRRGDSVLATDRRRLIKVGVFTKAEASAHLAGVLPLPARTGSGDQLAGLADDLGCLPLALSQAAAYLVDSGLTVTAYRDLLARRTTTLASVAPDVLPDDQTAPLATAWSLSVERADALRPVGLARPLLRLAAFLDPNGIPEAVLTSAPALAYLSRHRTHDGGDDPAEAAPVTAELAVGALRALDRLHLVEHALRSPQRTVRVHQLVQRAVREALTPDEHDRTALAAADALTAVWPAVERSTETARALRANTAVLSGRAGSTLRGGGASGGVHAVLYRAGRSLGETGLAGEAASYFDDLARAVADECGPDDPSVWQARFFRADCRGRTGDVAAAVSAYESLLTDRHVRRLGPLHGFTLSVRSALAFWQGLNGDVVQAVAGLEDVLRLRARIHEEDSRDTFVDRGNLARFRGEAGEVARAVSDYASLLRDVTRELGFDDPVTLTTRNNLAFWRSQSEGVTDSVAEFARLLAQHDAKFGPDHPGSLLLRHNLAYARGAAGDPVSALAELRTVLEDRVRVLGEDDPETLRTRGAMAHWMRSLGDSAAAAAEYEEVALRRMSVLGPLHPDTISAVGEIVLLREGAPHPEDHVPPFRKIADELIRLAPHHPEVLAMRGRLARQREATHGPRGVVSALEELLRDTSRGLGPFHPETLAVRGGLTHWKGVAGGPDASVAAFEEYVQYLLPVHGPYHPDVLTCRSNLAHWIGEAGRPAEAAAAFEELLVDRTMVLGPHHPDTLANQERVVHWRARAERHGAGEG
ncbi:tetratricopeptide repeat protein [Streptomyces sp. NPDC101158]|uniref:tetratricopeptide repeat protein n=1 Tax=Streptomyces sp. NPDC101158 TaxID=3366117 RepID=UPI0037FB9943